MLPERVGEAWESVRHFAHLKLPSGNLPSLCAISSNAPQVMVVTADGCFLVYSIDFQKGGECHLLRKHCFNSKEEAKSTSVYSL
jgi:autophagy-related protein 18